VALDAPLRGDDTFREIAYEQHAGVGYLHYASYNGAMSTEQCRRLRHAYACVSSRRETRVIVLTGGSDYFSNGIHLNMIEAAEDPAEESWRNLNAINDLVRKIVDTDLQIVISALGGDAATGGAPLALAADYVVAREDVVLNPYYQHMGGLYGSEHWTYLLPRRIGAEMTARLVSAPFIPIGAHQARRSGYWTQRSAPPWTAFTARPVSWQRISQTTPTSSARSSESAAGARTTTASSRCTSTAAKSRPSPIAASSVPNPATTKRGGDSSRDPDSPHRSPRDRRNGPHATTGPAGAGAPDRLQPLRLRRPYAKTGGGLLAPIPPPLT
jgi:enoyl-CoA hydratase/carnithine racemase